MLSRWPIRVKILVGLGLLVLLVTILAASGLHTMYAYRALAKNLSWRVTELPVAGELGRGVAELRITLGELRGLRRQYQPPDYIFADARIDPLMLRASLGRDRFHSHLDQAESTLARYRTHLNRKLRDNSKITGNRLERATVRKIEAALQGVRARTGDEAWIYDDTQLDLLQNELAALESLTAELPSHLHHRLTGFRNAVRREYRALIFGTWATMIVAALVLLLFVRLSWRWVLHPLRTIIQGSQRVAAGEFGYRIHLDGQDEMAQLAEAMNQMTSRFETIRDDLDRQVRERTKQAIRSERLAGVGFLAAGVAHEINNPLASIAMCAESLQGRLAESDSATDQSDEQQEIVGNYLQMIQDEAFRCKEITEKLLDFSRMGQPQRQSTDVGQLVEDTIELVSHMDKYGRKRIEFSRNEPVLAEVSGPEIKQVVLNLLTNALDSVADTGTVRIALRANDGFAELKFTDDGCGMEPDILEHVFEPFFTRRLHQRGIGLGLSITHRIVADHGGEITAESPGHGCGATFRVRLPLRQASKESDHRHKSDHHQAA